MTEKSVAKPTAGSPPAGASDVVVTTDGRTTISSAVVSKIAGVAVREVPGVHALGGSTARAVGAVRARIPGSSTNNSQGITVEVGERQAAVDVQLVVDYGVAIRDMAVGIRRNVINAIERMTGLEVVEVNVEVQDIHIETAGSSTPPAEPRVQ